MAETDDGTKSFGRYGLQLLEEPALQMTIPGARAERSSQPPLFQLFEWLLLSGFAALELAYLAGLVQLARWALGPLIGA